MHSNLKSANINCHIMETPANNHHQIHRNKVLFIQGKIFEGTPTKCNQFTKGDIRTNQKGLIRNALMGRGQRNLKVY